VANGKNLHLCPLLGHLVSHRVVTYKAHEDAEEAILGIVELIPSPTLASMEVEVRRVTHYSCCLSDIYEDERSSHWSLCFPDPTTSVVSLLFLLDDAANHRRPGEDGTCEFCGMKGVETVSVHSYVVRSSEFLILSLSRFSFSGGIARKIRTGVTMQLEQVLGDSTYYLIGAVFHTGEYGSGHYVAL
jgi:hypothetical protein